MDRGIAIARATGAGRLLVPMMLVKGYPLEIQGRLAEALEVCEEAVESARLSANPHYQFWALFELGWVHYYRVTCTPRWTCSRRAARVGGLLAGATMPAGSGGPGWPLAATLFELGERGARLRGDALDRWRRARARDPGGELLLLGDPGPRGAEARAARRRRRAHGARRRARRDARPQAARDGDPARSGRAAAGERGPGGRGEGRPGVGGGGARPSAAQLPAAYARGLLGQVLAAAGDRAGAIEELRSAESELDRCGSVRVRDELRRDLRKLGARAETRGPATGEDSGVGSLTKRELEIALS